MIFDPARRENPSNTPEILSTFCDRKMHRVGVSDKKCNNQTFRHRDYRACAAPLCVEAETRLPGRQRHRPSSAKPKGKAEYDREDRTRHHGGGKGTRLWPLSRATAAKQFIRFIGDKTLFQGTLDRVTDQDLYEPALVITNEEFRFLVAEQAREMDSRTLRHRAGAGSA